MCVRDNREETYQGCRKGVGNTLDDLGKPSEKKHFFLDIVQKGWGVQPESKSVEVVLFSPILTLFWTINGGRRGGLTLF